MDIFTLVNLLYQPHLTHKSLPLQAYQDYPHYMNTKYTLANLESPLPFRKAIRVAAA